MRASERCFFITTTSESISKDAGHAVRHAMLMAAGLGTRLKPFTDMEPKALLPLMGVPMAQFALDALTHAGVGRIVANVHHHAERARAGLEALDRGQAELIVSDESAELLGSSGGLRLAAPHFEGKPFFLLNADVLCNVDLAALARTHEKLRARHGVRLTLTVFPKPPTGPSGIQREKYREILLDPERGLVTGLGEHTIGRPYFVGAAVIEQDALGEIPAAGPGEFVPTVLLPAIRAQKAGVFLAKGNWHDVGSPALWLEAHLSMLRALETGRLSRSWRARLEKDNRRVASEVWVSKDAKGRAIRTARWAGPAYWSPQRDSTANAPLSFGPDAVLYGPAQGVGTELNSGIGFRGVWSGVPTSSRPG
jgi:NDP-sugar pyrophosphorylase family protein